ncbi:hypothetical protein MTR67_030680 [Solanum verrucosum]|uniref:Uncharacterized protein n=1 Tax=Solanum verrucosum TaxID=315347 RepID=A0AAF0RAR8_SOLVR|nr:hypothetical protein MTR67_030680 [Solanum verrucosum]
MNVLYHSSKANVVADSLCRLSMGSVTRVEEERKELAKDTHWLDILGVCFISMSNGGVTVQNGIEYSLVAEVKEKQDNDPLLLPLKGAVHQQKVQVFSQGGDGVLRYQVIYVFLRCWACCILIELMIILLGPRPYVRTSWIPGLIGGGLRLGWTLDSLGCVFSTRSYDLLPLGLFLGRSSYVDACDLGGSS